MTCRNIGLDTSVLMRILTGLPEEQALTAKAFMQKAMAAGRRLVVTDLVIAEAYFAMTNYYEIDKKRALAGILEVFESGCIHPAPGCCAPEILRKMSKSSSKPGFVDRMIHREYELSSTPMASFEKASQKLRKVMFLQ